jgi:hypothetical protein
VENCVHLEKIDFTTLVVDVACEMQTVRLWIWLLIAITRELSPLYCYCGITSSRSEGNKFRFVMCECGVIAPV